MGLGRLAKYLFKLKVIGEKFEADFDKANRKDIEKFVSWLRDQRQLST